MLLIIVLIQAVPQNTNALQMDAHNNVVNRIEVVEVWTHPKKFKTLFYLCTVLARHLYKTFGAVAVLWPTSLAICSDSLVKSRSGITCMARHDANFEVRLTSGLPTSCRAPPIEFGRMGWQ